MVDDDDFKENTEVYAITQTVSVPAGVKITPPAEGITGHPVSYTLPTTDASWKGVFIRAEDLIPRRLRRNEGY